MKKIAVVLGLIACWMPSLLFAQFEGIIDLKHTFGKAELTHETLVSMFVKNNLMAFKPTGGAVRDEGRVIYRGDKHRLWIVDDQKQTYLEIDLSKNRQSDDSEDTGTDTGNKDRVKFHKTGKTENILGYPCEEIIIESDSEVHDIWGTSKLGNIFEGLIQSFGSMAGQKKNLAADDWRNELMHLSIFPLKTITTERGEVTQQEEVTKIEKKSVPASNFELPETYKKQSFDFDLGGMTKELQEELNKGKGNREKVDLQKMMKELEEKMKSHEKDSTKDKDNE